LIGEKVVLEGEIDGPVETTPRGAKAVVKLSSGKILLTLPSVPSWERGDRIRFETRVKRPRRYKNPGSFDYRNYLERKGILLTGFIERPEEVEVLSKGEEASGAIDRLRRKIVEGIDETVEEPAAGFLAALTVGDRSGMTDDLWNDFRNTGTAHLVAISGQHIGMVAGAFYLFFLWILKRSERLLLSFSVRRLAGLLALAPVVFYTVLAGSPPSAVRAAILAGLVVLAPFVGREIDFWSALAAAAIGISLFDPSAPFSASFQLSFLAVAGILLFRPRRDASQGAVSSRGGPASGWNFAPTIIQKYLMTPFWMTLGATLATAPLIAYLFHIISFSGLLTNLWAIPSTGFLLIASGASLFLTFLIPPLGAWLLSLCGHLADWFLRGIDLSSRFSWTASFYPTEFELVSAFLLVALLAWIRLRPGQWRIAAAGSLLVAGFWCLTSLNFLERDLEVTFLDVGQGDAALVLTPERKTLLVDGGGFLIPGKPPSFDIGSEVLVPYLKRRGIRRIDAILLSHPHPDHYGGLQAVVENFPIGEFWWNGGTFPDETFDHLLQTVAGKEIPARILREGDRFEWEGLSLEVLYPPGINPKRSINDNSLVVRLSFGEARFLFPGDIEKEGERALEDLRIEAEVVKIPHHASRTSSSVPFIDGVRPRYAIASLGEDNFFGFPHPGVLEKYERRGVKVCRTDRDGAVTIVVSPEFPRRPIAIRTFSSGE
jgi:competence protein ComEC